MEITVGRGDAKKKVQVSEADDRSLSWYVENAHNDAIREACAAELERRGASDGAAPSPAEQPQRQQPASNPAPTAVAIGASIASGGSLMATLEKMSERAILVAPTVACEHLPEGAEVAISMVRADVNSQDCHVIVGNRKNPSPTDSMGLGSPLLQRLAAAAGVSWVREATVRTDDGKNPYKVSYRAWARTQDVDGTFRDFPGECEVDLSDGGPQALDIIDKAHKSDRDPEKQLAEARKFIQRSTMTKAMNVAIRKALGLRHSYTRQELLAKPFAVTKLLFTGRTDDPTLKPLFAQILAQRFGYSTEALYGAPRLSGRAAAPRVVPAQGQDITDGFVPPDEY